MKLTELNEPLERIIQGKRNWWFLGPGGIAGLDIDHVTPEGTLRPDAERYLRDQGMFRAAPTSAYLLTVLTSTDCNLGCGYCFQNTSQDMSGGNRPPRIAHARLTSATITATLNFVARHMAQAGLEQLKVLLFGGEPLLNPRACVELLTRAADYGLVSASMISNLTLLTPELASQLATARLQDVQVTFDGDREEHDRIRVRRSGGGTFDAIVRNLNRACAAAPAIKWRLRVNVSHRNRPGIANLIDRLAGVLDTSRCSIYFVPVGDASIGYSNELSYTRDLAAEFAGWNCLALDLGFSISWPTPHLPCQTCSYRNGRYGAAVSADGTLSSCWDAAGKPGWQVGTVADGYLPAEQTRNRWASCEDSYVWADEKALLSFHDEVDAAVLDYLSETGRL